ncbi:MAG TPA: 30S ribosomal protein S15 [Candidatus Acidoferrum sp.]|nr:30S ribosomal protein S15 [Candidatus Acidoferrum sp.]
MARMHTKKKGKSASKKPLIANATNESGLSNEKIADIIEGYAKQGMDPALIGERLKREHKVLYLRHATGKRMLTILQEKGLAGQVPSDMLQLMKKAVGMRAHMAVNTKDVHARVRLGRVESKIWRLTKYYIRENRLPKGWRYDPKEAELLIKGRA